MATSALFSSGKRASKENVIVERVKTHLLRLLRIGDLGLANGICRYLSVNLFVDGFKEPRVSTVSNFIARSSETYQLAVGREWYDVRAYIDERGEFTPLRRTFVEGLLIALERKDPSAPITVEFWKTFLDYKNSVEGERC